MEVTVAKLDMAMYAGACTSESGSIQLPSNALRETISEDQGCWRPPPLPSLDSSSVCNLPVHCSLSSSCHEDVRICDAHSDRKFNDSEGLDTNRKTNRSSELGCDDIS